MSFRKLSPRSISPQRRRRRNLGCERLSDRLMMHGGGLCDQDHDHGHDDVDPSIVVSTANLPAEYAGYGNDASGDPRIPDFRLEAVTDSPLDWLESSLIPAYSSKPGAAATLYLDFDGNFEDGPWRDFEDINTPAFDLDGIPNIFSQRERDVIRDTYLAVAEDFAPFDINVTTVNPGDFSDGAALRIAIGGHPHDWYVPDESRSPTGTSARNSFTAENSNVAFVFAESLQGVADDRDYSDAQLALLLGNTSSHEAGHSLGLAHQSSYDADGNKTDSYAEGTDDWTPIMGSNLQVDRTTWHDGPTPDGADDLQDDMAILARAENGFGYRADDHGNSTMTASPLETKSVWHFGSQLVGSGIVEQTSDVDFFHFTTTGGGVTIDLDVADFAPNLDARLELWSAGSGIVTPAKDASSKFGSRQSIIDASRVYIPSVMLAASDPAGELGASISTSLEPGEYFIAVKSHGQYGDVGQYSVSAHLPADPLIAEPIPRRWELERLRTELPLENPQTPPTPEKLDQRANLLNVTTSTAKPMAAGGGLRQLVIDKAMAEDGQLDSTPVQLRGLNWASPRRILARQGRA